MDINQAPTTQQAVNPHMAAFNLQTKSSYYLSDSDFERGTLAVYGKRIQLLESPNDTTHEYNDVNGEVDNEDDLETAIADGDIQCWNADVVLNDLVRRGVLPAGDYFMRVSW